MTNSRQNSTFQLWGALFIIAFIMPVSAFYLVNNFIFEKSSADEIRALGNFADTSAQRLQYSGDNNEFWCHELNRIFARAKEVTDFEKAIRELAARHRQKMSWIIWDDRNRVTVKNITSRHSDATWKRVADILRKASENWFSDMSKDDDVFVRSVLGEHLQTKTFKRATFRNNPDLNTLSFFKPTGSLWADFNEKAGVMVLFPPDTGAKFQGLKEFINSSDWSDYGIGLFKGDHFFTSDSQLTKADLLSLNNFFIDKAPEIRHYKNRLITGRYVAEDIFFCIFQRKAGNLSSTRNTILFALLTAFVWVLVLGEFHHGRLSTGFSIKHVVIGLIGFSNLFPILVMILLGQQYLEQKRQILIEERRVEATNFLSKIEGDFVAETHKIKSFAIKHISNLGQTLRQEPLSIDNTIDFRKSMQKVAGKFMVIASTTFPTISDVAFLNQEKSTLLSNTESRSLEFIETSGKQKMDRLKLNETMCKCGAAFIAFYNGTSLPDKVLTEVELIIEALFQSRLNATYHRFLRLLDHVEKIGMGTEKHPTFMHFLSFNAAGLADYLFLFHFNIGAQAQNFMSSRNSLLQGNQQGIKVAHTTGTDLKAMKIEPFQDQEKFRDLFSKLTNFPQPSAEFVELNGETWISTGFISNTIADTSLLALSRVREIDLNLEFEKQQLLAVMLINILLVAGITLIFVQTLLQPVFLLQTVTAAIRARDFSFRVPELGKDEFGKMARVFNSALVDLEEMSLARDVQQQLFPRQQVETGCYDLFCKTITMADLGGDYLDVFQVSQTKFVIILGDVAGHGVGAAMIMAMAKSAMINSSDLLEQPPELLARLHNLIYRTKSKRQRKIMTFQYVMVDTETHKITFSNAGGCNPYLVRAQPRSVEEIILPGAALGSFKNSKFNQAEISLEPGDSLILYTDGLVESRNNAGEEFGYERFSNALVENLCDSSQIYYDRIMIVNSLWRQDQPRQDDLSLMVLRRS